MKHEHEGLEFAAVTGIVLGILALLLAFIVGINNANRADDANRDIDELRAAICEQVKDVPTYKNCIEGWDH